MGNLPAKKALEEQPEIPEWLSPFWSAFNILTRSRVQTFGGPGPIPLTEIESYFRLFYITDLEEREEYLQILIVMDREFLKYHAELQKRENNRNKT